MTKTTTPKLDGVAMHLLALVPVAPTPIWTGGTAPGAAVRIGTLQICRPKIPLVTFGIPS